MVPEQVPTSLLAMSGRSSLALHTRLRARQGGSIGQNRGKACNAAPMAVTAIATPWLFVHARAQAPPASCSWTSPPRGWTPRPAARSGTSFRRRRPWGAASSSPPTAWRRYGARRVQANGAVKSAGMCIDITSHTPCHNNREPLVLHHGLVGSRAGQGSPCHLVKRCTLAANPPPPPTIFVTRLELPYLHSPSGAHGVTGRVCEQPPPLRAPPPPTIFVTPP
jgi:hypothetical protein